MAGMTAALKSTVPVLADVLAVLVYVLLLSRLTERFGNRSVGNGILIAAVYIVFCVCVYLLRLSIAVNTPGSSGLGSVMIAWSLFFGLIVSYMIMDLSGLLTFLVDTPLAEMNQVMEGTRGAVLSLVAVVAFLVVMALYPISMMAGVRPLWSPDGWVDGAVQAVSLLGVNLMVIIGMAHWEVSLRSESPYVGLGLGAKVLIFAGVYLFFLLFYGSPRMVFFKANPSAFAVATFFAHTGYYVWRFLAGSAWK